MKICLIEGCEKIHKAKGYCESHYARLKRVGFVDIDKPIRFRSSKLGISKNILYKIWASMKDRCYNSNCKAYYRYGGRGISVCDRWRDSFEIFLKDMDDRPFNGAQLDRIDNDGNYEPSNCRWTTPIENSRNKSTTKLNETDIYFIRLSPAKGVDLAKLFNVHRSVISNILSNRVWKI